VAPETRPAPDASARKPAPLQAQVLLLTAPMPRSRCERQAPRDPRSRPLLVLRLKALGDAAVVEEGEGLIEEVLPVRFVSRQHQGGRVDVKRVVGEELFGVALMSGYEVITAHRVGDTDVGTAGEHFQHGSCDIWSVDDD